MSAEDRRTWGEPSRTATRVERGRVQCPWCGRWNDMEGSAWYVGYDGRGKYSMFRFMYCIRCEKEIYIDLEIAGLKVREE